MEATRKATLVAFLSSLLILGLKVYAAVITGSMVMMSDALESVVNVVASLVAWRVMVAVHTPADEDHPYGHGKLENFSASFEGGLILFAGVVIVFQSVQAFWSGKPLDNLNEGLIFVGVAAFMNLALGLYLQKVAAQHRSEAIKASAVHVLSDVWTTVGALLGVGLVRLTGLQFFDPLASLILGLHLGFSGYAVVRRNLGTLMDEVEIETLKSLALALNSSRSPGVIDVHLTKVIRSGSFHHIDSHLVVPEFWTVSQTHDFMEDFEARVVKAYPVDGEINFHVDPCGKDFCSVCELKDCPLRQRPFGQLRPFSAEGITQTPQRDPT